MHAYIHTYMHTYIHTCVCVCVCVCVLYKLNQSKSSNLFDYIIHADDKCTSLSST